MSEKRGMSTVARKRILVLVVSVLLAYLYAVGFANFAKSHDERALATLALVRHRLEELGLSGIKGNVGLEFGYYAGCRTWLLEHLIADGCVGFRIDEGLRAQTGPEKIRDIVEEVCRDEADRHSEGCPYRRSFVLTVRYFRVALAYQDANSTTVVREQSGELSRYWINGGKQQ